MYLLVYIILYMLPHTVILMCAFQLSYVKTLVEIFILFYKNLISWFMRNLIALIVACLSCCLRPLILILM